MFYGHSKDGNYSSALTDAIRLAKTMFGTAEIEWKVEKVIESKMGQSVGIRAVPFYREVSAPPDGLQVESKELTFTNRIPIEVLYYGGDIPGGGIVALMCKIFSPHLVLSREDINTATATLTGAQAAGGYYHQIANNEADNFIEAYAQLRDSNGGVVGSPVYMGAIDATTCHTGSSVPISFTRAINANYFPIVEGVSIIFNFGRNFEVGLC